MEGLGEVADGEAEAQGGDSKARTLAPWSVLPLTGHGAGYPQVQPRDLAVPSLDWEPAEDGLLAASVSWLQSGTG